MARIQHRAEPPTGTSDAPALPGLCHYRICSVDMETGAARGLCIHGRERDRETRPRVRDLI